MHFHPSRSGPAPRIILVLLVLLFFVLSSSEQRESSASTFQCPPISLTPSALPDGKAGEEYDQDVDVVGGLGSYSFAIIFGSLPAGLTLTPASGRISGVPTVTGTFPFTIRALDKGACQASKTYSLTMSCPLVRINPPILPEGILNARYSQRLTGTDGVAPYTFALRAGSLPLGLTLSAQGEISGTPTTKGSSTFSIRIVDANGCEGSREYTIKVGCPTISVNPGVLPFAHPGASYSQDLTASGGQGAYTFALTSGSLPAGLTLSSSGRISGTPTSLVESEFTVGVTDSNSCAGSKTYRLAVVCPVITVNPTAFPSGSVGRSYSYGLTYVGAPKLPITFSVSRGNLPDGLSISTATLTGTPTVAGTFAFTIRVTDANGCYGERDYEHVINPCPSSTISPNVLSVAQVGSSYLQTLSAIGSVGPYTFTVFSGALPPGLTLATSGQISGNPTTAGSFSFIARATGTSGCFADKEYNVSVTSCPSILMSPTTPELPRGSTGILYSQTFSATGGAGPYTYALTGQLPPGLALNATTGVLSGPPSQAGGFIFSIRATDANGCPSARSYLLSIESGCPSIAISPTVSSLPPATTGTPYTQGFSAMGGQSPYSFSISSGTLPGGLTLASNGTLAGTPTVSGSFNFRVQARDANGCLSERSYTVLVNDPTCPSVSIIPNNSLLPAGTVGTAYSQTFSGTGGTGPYVVTLTLGLLPAGLSLSSSGVLNGTPTLAGDYTFNVRVTDSKGCLDEAGFDLEIENATCPAITVTTNSNSISPGTLGVSYLQTISASGGTGPYSFAVMTGSLPQGLALAASGTLSGTPTVVGNFAFTVRSTDNKGCTGERSFTITISPASIVSVSAASFANTNLALESLVSGFGAGLASVTEAALTRPLPTEMSGVRVLVRDATGLERPAPLFYISPRQLNYQMPPGISLGSASITVLNGTNIVAAGVVGIDNVSPGVFSADATGKGLAAALVYRLKSNGTESYEPVARYDAVQARFVAEPIDLGPATDQVFLVLFGTGWKFRSGLSTMGCSVGGINSEVVYAGEAPGYTALEQMNVRLSRSLIGRGEVDVVVSVEGKVANAVRVVMR